MTPEATQITAQASQIGKTFIFQVVLEADGDGWHVFCPALLSRGASTWGETKEQAMAHIQEVTQMVVESLIEFGDPLPDDTTPGVSVCEGPRVVISL